jgi:DNA-binding NarL/FixJ family response regulator
VFISWEGFVEGGGLLKKIIILPKHSMFSQGIEQLLSMDGGFEIVGEELDLNNLAEYVERESVSVVIVNCDDPDTGLTPTMKCFLRERLGVCVIALSLKDNKMCIYRGENKRILSVEDLTEAIRD